MFSQNRCRSLFANRTILGSVIALASFALSAQASTILIDNDFGGGPDIGPAFQGFANTFGTGGGGDPATGIITTGNNTNSTRGLNNVSLVTVPGGTTSLTATFVVASAPANVASLSANGLFFGIVSGPSATATDSTAIYVNAATAFGYIAGSTAWGDHQVVQDLDLATTAVLFGLPSVPTNTSFANGFTVAVTITSDNTWSIVTTGLSTNATGTGGYTGNLNTNQGVGGFDFSTFITGGVGLNSSLQSNAVSVDIDRATLVAVPEPSGFVLATAGVIGGAALIRRRLRTAVNR